MDAVAAHAICDATDPVAAFAADATLWGDMVNDRRLAQALREAFARVKQFEQERA